MAQLNFTMSDFVEKFFYLKSRPFSLDDYPHMRILYNIDTPEIVIHSSRQISKSTTLANLALGRMLVMPQTHINYYGGFNVLYIAPTVEQVKTFSHDRIEPVIEQSPIIKKYYVNSSLVQNVFMKRFANGSSMYFRYAAASPDKARGLSVDMIMCDETQDIPSDHIDIIQQAMSRSMYKRTIYAGTPKRTIGALAKRWFSSTQNDWLPKCTHCNKWNYLDERNISREGMVCRFCHKPLDARNGTWVRANNNSAKSERTGEYIFEGFRINILMFSHAPWVDWQKDVWIPFNEKPRGLFLNEYLGLAYDSGVSPISEQEIRACCTGGPMRKEPDAYTSSYPRFMGLDWGPINSENSATVMSIILRKGSTSEVVYLKRFLGRESDYSYLHGQIPAEYRKWQINLIGADHGFGEAPNAEVRMRIADPNRLIAFFHLGNQKQKANWNKNMNAYTLGRNRVMTEFFQKIKRRQIIFPCWEDFQPFAKDIMSIQIDYDEDKGRYKYINSDPDDAFHSMLYGNLASELWYMTQGE
jgi:hypothetical protein